MNKYTKLNLIPLIGKSILFRKIPYDYLIEATVLKVSANGQFVKLGLPNENEYWEEIDLLKLEDIPDK